MTILAEAKLITRTSKQTLAVARYLEEHGQIDNVTAIESGIPPVGRIFRLTARIWELRHDYGYEIETKQLRDGNTIYRLIRKPAPKQLALV